MPVFLQGPGPSGPNCFITALWRALSPVVTAFFVPLRTARNLSIPSLRTLIFPRPGKVQKPDCPLHQSATRCFPLAQLCRRGTSDPLHQHPSFACREHQEPETPLLLVLHLSTSCKAGGLPSAPKTKRRRTGPAGRLLPTSQLVQRSGFETLVSCKQVSAVKTETYFFSFSYFHISVSHCRCRSCVQ